MIIMHDFIGKDPSEIEKIVVKPSFRIFFESTRQDEQGHDIYDPKAVGSDALIRGFSVNFGENYVETAKLCQVGDSSKTMLAVYLDMFAAYESGKEVNLRSLVRDKNMDAVIQATHMHVVDSNSQGTGVTGASGYATMFNNAFAIPALSSLTTSWTSTSLTKECPSNINTVNINPFYGVQRGCFMYMHSMARLRDGGYNPNTYRHRFQFDSVSIGETAYPIEISSTWVN